MRIDLCDIKIPKKFAMSTPNPYKVGNIAFAYARGENIGKDIVVNASGILVDGYIRYLVMMKMGCLSADVTIVPDDFNIKTKCYEKNPTLYVFGKHHDNGKTYVWRMTKKTKHPELLEVGAMVQVATAHGAKRVTVERIELLDKPPVDTPIRKVRECYKKPKEQ